MLTRSSVPARSPSASPNSSHTSFQYAPASPQHRSSNAPTAVSRPTSTMSPLGTNTSLPSRSSMALPKTSPKRPKHPECTTNYTGVDAATQYSPIVPHEYLAPHAPLVPSLPLRNSHPTHDTLPRQASPPQPTASPTSTAPTEQAAATTAILPGDEPVTPTTRRSSQGPGVLLREASAAGQEAVGVLAKRAKSDTAPPRLLPVRYEFCATEDMVVLIANMLAELIETNDALALRSGHLTRFHSRTAPGISVLDYLHRLARHATLTPPLLLSMVYYIDRLCASYPDFTINTLTVHRFLITAATVAAKGLSDSFWNNPTYARVGGVRVAELKLLELEFLHRVDWKIIPDPEVLVAYYRGLVQRSSAYVLQQSMEQDDAVDGNG